jgi:hypothetical protein
MARRAPTEPGEITPEWAAAQAETAHQRCDSLEVNFRAMHRRVEGAEHKLIETRGIDGKGGDVAWLKQALLDAKLDLERRQRESAQAQGKRLESLGTMYTQLDKEVREIQVGQVDMRARIFSAASTALSVIALALTFYKTCSP